MCAPDGTITLDVWATGEGPWHLVVEHLDGVYEVYYGSLVNESVIDLYGPLTVKLTNEPTKKSWGGTVPASTCDQPKLPDPEVVYDGEEGG